MFPERGWRPGKTRKPLVAEDGIDEKRLKRASLKHDREIQSKVGPGGPLNIGLTIIPEKRGFKDRLPEKEKLSSSIYGT